MRLQPNALRLSWELLVAASAVIAALEIPARLVLDPQHVAQMLGLDWALTGIFVADLLLRIYKSGWISRQPATNSSSRASRYTWRWFVVDLCAAFPFAVLSAFPLLQLLRLLKLARVATLMGRWQRIHSQNPSVIRLVIFFFWLSLSAHWIACGWLALRGVATSLDPTTNYLLALYWGVTTLTTVGYGDITPATNAERLYTMVIMVLGVGVYGYVIGNVAGLLTNIDPARTRHRELVEKVTAFMRYRRVPAGLQRRILDYYEYLWDKRLGYDESAAILELPPTLRTEVALFLNRDIIQQVPLFQGASDGFIRAIALEMQPVLFMPGDYIMRAGEPGDEMYFISHGTVEILSADEQVVFTTRSSGEFFGEIALLFSQPRTASVRAIDYCDLYSLSRVAFNRVLARHPDVEADIRAIANQRLEENASREENIEESA